MAREQTDRGCFDCAAVLRFSGSRKPSWPAWFVGRREMSVTEACDWQREQWGPVSYTHLRAHETSAHL
eukprot:5010546-Alexandrium_andersonii.AAC.1